MWGKGKMNKGCAMDPKCVHAKNETRYVSMNWPFILEWVQGGSELDKTCIYFYVIQQRKTNDWLWRF
jgi:hypothetical protein